MIITKARIQVHLNTACLSRNVYHFDQTNYYLLDVNCVSYNKICSIVSKI